MALVLKDRVKETTTTTGTGTITLAGASTGYQSFSVIGNANTTYYCIAGQGTAEWEVGIGTYTASGTTLSRDTILASSNSGSVVTFSAGTKDVFVVYPAGKSVNQDASGNVGIGTSSPTAKLHTVVTDASSVLTLERTGAGATSFTADFSGAVFNQSLSGGADYVWKEGGTEWMRLTNTGNVGIGTSSPTNKLTVDGNANITGNTTLGDASGDTLTINAGTVTIGSNYNWSRTGITFAAGSSPVLTYSVSGTADAGGTTSMYAAHNFNTTITGANAAVSINGGQSYAGHTGSATVGTLIGWGASSALTSTGNVTTLYGLYANNTLSNTGSVTTGSAIAVGSPTLSSTGTITTYNGIQIFNVGNANITSAYGLNINDITNSTNMRGIFSQVSSGANKYNFYASGTAANYFAGNVGIGTSSPSQILQVTGSNSTGFVGERIQNNNANTGIAGLEFSSDVTYSKAAIGLLRQDANGKGPLVFYVDSNNDAANWSTGDEKMRLDSSGNVGIGTSSPTSRLHVSNSTASTNAIAQFTNGTTGTGAGNGLYVGIDTSNEATVYNFYNSALKFGTNGVERMRLDSSGNLGLGVTPSAAGTYRLLQLPTAGQFGTNGATAFFTSNAYLAGAGTWTYATSNVATRYSQDGGAHSWSYAPSGIAGNAISFTQAMTLDASGRLLIGSTSSNSAFGGNLQVEGTSGAFSSFVRYSTSAAGAPGLYLARSKGATVGTNTIVASGDTLGNLLFSGANGTGYSDAASISAFVDGTPGASADMPGRLVFSTSSDGSATPTERMRIDSSGNVGIGTSSLTGYSLRVGKTVTGAVDSVGVLSNGLVQSDVTSSAAQLQAQIGLAASAFTLSNAFGLYVGQTALSGGAAITSQYGVYVANSLTGATNNYGFYSNIASSANRYNFFANGTAENYFAGNIGIGAVAGSTTGQLRIAGNGSGATTFNGITLETSIQSGVTSGWRGLLVRPTTQATAFTLSNLYGVYVNPQTFGAGSTVTNQYGFHAESTLTGATNNYGFYSNIASGTGRWNFYANGTADNYFAGNVGIGVSPSTKLDVSGTSRYTFNVANAYTLQTSLNAAGSAFADDYKNALSHIWQTSGTERMRIDSSGNVGIGTSSPSSKLEVYDATSAVARVTAGTEIFEIRNTGSEVRLAVVSADPMTFRTSNVEAMRIDSSGNVGIGTSSPNDKLTVASDNYLSFQTSSTTFNSGRVARIGGVSVGSGNGYLVFETYQGGSGGGERMRIDSSGNLLIGGTTSYGKLTTYVGNNSRFAATTSSGAGGGAGGWQLPAYYGSVKVNYIDCELTDGTGGSEASVMRFATIGSGTLAERMRIDSSGNLLVGTTSQPVSTYRQVIQYSSNGGQGGIMFNDTDGGTTLEACYFRKDGSQRGYIRVTTSGTTYATVSDYRLKTDVAPMIGALAKVMALNPCTYTWKETNKKGQGFIAHELAEVVPDCVTGEKDATRMEQYEISPAVPATYDDDGNKLTPAVAAVMGEREVPAYQGIDTSFLVATLTAAIQEQQAIIQSLTARIAALEAQ